VTLPVSTEFFNDFGRVLSYLLLAARGNSGCARGTLRFRGTPVENRCVTSVVTNTEYLNTL